MAKTDGEGEGEKSHQEEEPACRPRPSQLLPAIRSRRMQLCPSRWSPCPSPRWRCDGVPKLEVVRILAAHAYDGKYSY